MGQKLTFIHAADLHLGAPFRGLRSLSPAWANRLMRALAESFDCVIDQAISRNVDFVIIAGDIFDSARPSYADTVHFSQGMQRLNNAGIPAYLVTGNHDPYTSWQHDFGLLPPQTYMLSAETPDFRVFERAGQPLCIIGGRGYYNQTWNFDECIAKGVTRAAAEDALRERYPHISEVPFAVGVLHTGLDLDPVKAPVKPKMLLHAGMNYWALGHIHARYVAPSEADPRIVFSGCVQGRDIKETGSRGIFEVTLEQGKPNKIQFIPTASVVWQQLCVDVSHAATLPDITAQVMRELFRLNGAAHCEEMVTRITLTGKTPLHEKLAQPEVLADLRKHINDSYQMFFCDALINKTVAPRDKRALKKEKLFPATLMAAAARQQKDLEAALAYVQDEFIKSHIPMPSLNDEALATLSSEAEDLVLDLLTREAK